MRVLNKYGDELGSIFDYSTKQLYLMLKYKECIVVSKRNQQVEVGV